jgi:hypothetical protein
MFDLLGVRRIKRAARKTDTTTTASVLDKRVDDASIYREHTTNGSLTPIAAAKPP